MRKELLPAKFWFKDTDRDLIDVGVNLTLNGSLDVDSSVPFNTHLSTKSVCDHRRARTRCGLTAVVQIDGRGYCEKHAPNRAPCIKCGKHRERSDSDYCIRCDPRNESQLCQALKKDGTRCQNFLGWYEGDGLCASHRGRKG